ncbi:N(2)-acetyl-L-2,4-diaminobutanoate deacetylase DoeB2 [Actinotalea soli]|uniref:N(2)-acetyl-L-2,4-diaminobutanoate deacetylase DoeB2 n=1 Tax=Actinotalea soli TaxID=2819234 RepID=UPI0027DC25DF|nr:N(2)-acetyl-L-2,4-diaminobutanoate deacetylase DoeB2 [Actinotalea soli]
MGAPWLLVVSTRGGRAGYGRRTVQTTGWPRDQTTPRRRPVACGVLGGGWVRVGWSTLVDAGVALRRDLHRRPEVAWQEHGTAETVRAELHRLNVPHRPCAGTGTLATLAPTAPGRHIALRADLDGMPVQESTGAPWSSLHEGVMHACGHDGHMATLLTAAAWLQAHEDELPGPVTLLFQPAEEGGHGARGMIEDGALDGHLAPRPVDVVFGWHNWPAIPYGQAVCPDGPVMSANGTFVIEITGQGGHASQPEATRDPVLAAAAITLALQQVVARRLPPNQAAVVAVTSIDARAGAPTVTPEHAVVSGSIRIGDTAQRAEVFALIAEIATATASAYGVQAVTTPTPRYGATVNAPAPAAELRAALSDELGEGWLSTGTPVPVMASEDFSYYLDEVPGAFALVGGGDGAGHDESCHSPRYDFNDDLLERVARVYVQLAGAPAPPPRTSSAVQAAEEATTPS